MLLMFGLRKLKLLRKFVSIARHTYNLATYSYKTEMLGTMHWAVLFGYNILQLSGKTDMAKVDGKGIIMLMVTEEGNKNRNVIRTQRTKRKTKRRSLRRNRKHTVEWRRNRTRINIKTKRRSGEGDRYVPLENFITRNPGISLRSPKFLWIRIRHTKPSLCFYLTRMLLENCSLNAGRLFRVSWSETWRITITGSKALRRLASVRVCFQSVTRDDFIWLTWSRSRITFKLPVINICQLRIQP